MIILTILKTTDLIEEEDWHVLNVMNPMAIILGS